MGEVISARASFSIVSAQAELELLGGAGGLTSDLEDPRLLDHAMYVLSPRLAAAPRTAINVRIVIVGASDAALAAASSLVLQVCCFPRCLDQKSFAMAQPNRHAGLPLHCRRL